MWPLTSYTRQADLARVTFGLRDAWWLTARVRLSAMIGSLSKGEPWWELCW